jgi:hypothetical protein
MAAAMPYRASGPHVSVPSSTSAANTRAHTSARIPNSRCAYGHVRRRHGISLNSARIRCSNSAREALFRRSGLTASRGVANMRLSFPEEELDGACATTAPSKNSREPRIWLVPEGILSNYSPRRAE